MTVVTCCRTVIAMLAAYLTTTFSLSCADATKDLPVIYLFCIIYMFTDVESSFLGGL